MSRSAAAFGESSSFSHGGAEESGHLYGIRLGLVRHFGIFEAHQFNRQVYFNTSLSVASDDNCHSDFSSSTMRDVIRWVLSVSRPDHKSTWAVVHSSRDGAPCDSF